MKFNFLLLALFCGSLPLLGEETDPRKIPLGFTPLTKFEFKDSKTADERYREFLIKGSAGLPGGMMDVGYCHYFGEGTPVDYEKALSWCVKGLVESLNVTEEYYFKLESKPGMSAAIVGCCYYEGNGAPKNFELAAKYFQRGAIEGNSFCQRRLAMCYLSGKGVAEQKTVSYIWMSIAATAGDGDAKKALPIIENTMTAAAIKEAQEVTQKWRPKRDK